MKRVYLFDIDGTVANVAHRLHHISEAFDDQGMKRKADWPAGRQLWFLRTVHPS